MLAFKAQTFWASRHGRSHPEQGDIYRSSRSRFLCSIPSGQSAQAPGGPRGEMVASAGVERGWTYLGRSSEDAEDAWASLMRGKTQRGLYLF